MALQNFLITAAKSEAPLNPAVAEVSPIFLDTLTVAGKASELNLKAGPHQFVAKELQPGASYPDTNTIARAMQVPVSDFAGRLAQASEQQNSKQPAPDSKSGINENKSELANESKAEVVASLLGLGLKIFCQPASIKGTLSHLGKDAIADSLADAPYDQQVAGDASAASQFVALELALGSTKRVEPHHPAQEQKSPKTFANVVRLQANLPLTNNVQAPANGISNHGPKPELLNNQDPSSPSVASFPAAILQSFEAMNLDAIKVPNKLELDTTTDHWVATLAHELVKANDLGNELEFRLTPRHLGMLEVGLGKTDFGITIELRASNEAAAQQIVQSEHRLLEELRQRGIAVSEYSIHSGPSSDGKNGRNEPKPNSAELTLDAGPTSQATEEIDESHPTGRFA